jgi:DNA repair protein RecO (recombination protein O)
VLRKFDYSEHSQILRLMTRESGVRSAIAKGVKKEKSSFGGALDLFYLGRAAVVHRPRAGLDILDSFRVLTAFPGLRADLRRYCAACHLAELLTGMTHEAEPHPALFDLTRGGLSALEAAPPATVPPLIASLELAALAELGFAPSLTCCADCGAAGDAAGEAGAGLSVRHGGLLCAACRAKDPAAERVEPGTLATLRALAAASPDAAPRIRLPAPARHAIREFLDSFETWRMDRPLRTARFLDR